MYIWKVIRCALALGRVSPAAATAFVGKLVFIAVFMLLRETLDEIYAILASDLYQLPHQLENRLKNLVVLDVLRIVIAYRCPQIFHLSISFEHELL